MNSRRLYRSRRNQMLAGVCGGLGEFFGLDPTIIRLVWAILFFTGGGLLAYILAAIIIPAEPDDYY